MAESFGPGNQTAIIAEQLMDAKTLGLTGNNNTPYIFRNSPRSLEL
jgi:hypothetical protein